MNRLMKEKKGFSLIEVIISIAVLSILCVIFLQLFIKAQNISDQSFVLDESVRIVNSYLEEIKGNKSLNSIKALESMAWLQFNKTDTGYVFEGSFDEVFHAVESETGNYIITITLTEVTPNKINSSKDTEHTKLFDVQAQMTDEIEMHKIIYKTNALIILEE